MSARQKLQHATSQLPEDVVERLLNFLHTLPASDPTRPSTMDDRYLGQWQRWYGRCGDKAWDEPLPLPQQTREIW